MRRLLPGAAVLMMSALLVTVPGAVSHAATAGVTVTATVGGSSLKEAGSNSPIVLRPDDATIVKVVVTNPGGSPVDVRTVRLSGRVLGLAFFSYSTRVDLHLDAGATGSRTFALDLSDLDGQATGLLPARLELLAPDRSVLYTENGTVDVKGRLASVYAVFGIAVAAITALLLLGLIVRLLRRTLPDNRWARAGRFAVPGLGLGLVVVFSLGAARVLVPSNTVAVALLVAGLVGGSGLGYLTPAPGEEADRNELDARDVTSVVEAPLAPTPGYQPPPPPPSSQPATGEDDPRATRVVGPPSPPPS